LNLDAFFHSSGGQIIGSGVLTLMLFFLVVRVRSLLDQRAGRRHAEAVVLAPRPIPSELRRAGAKANAALDSDGVWETHYSADERGGAVAARHVRAEIVERAPAQVGPLFPDPPIFAPDLPASPRREVPASPAVPRAPRAPHQTPR
jgi:hypothetical protein